MPLFLSVQLPGAGWISYGESQ